MNNYHIEGDSHIYPSRFDRWNRAHCGAYKKGVAAYHAGEHLILGCPYMDKLKTESQLISSRSFICAWQDGWRDARTQTRDLK